MRATTEEFCAGLSGLLEGQAVPLLARDIPETFLTGEVG